MIKTTCMHANITSSGRSWYSVFAVASNKMGVLGFNCVICDNSITLTVSETNSHHLSKFGMYIILGIFRFASLNT